MALRSLVAAGLASTVGAQLLFQPPTDPEAEVVPGNLSSPTLCDPAVKQHSGYLNAAPGVNYFFWLFESRRSPSTDPLLLWLNGGPGCSSMMGMLAENGPCSVGKDGKTVLNGFSWTAQANVMWVDQPADTGFSTGWPSTTGEAQVARDMYTFLQNFYKALPQYFKNDFFIMGESYAGHYVPAISHFLWQQGKNGGFKVPLKGIGIGNGLVDPEEQYKWYADMVKDGGKSEGGSLKEGVITNWPVQSYMRLALLPCEELIHLCTENYTVACAAAMVTCQYGEMIPYTLTGMNVYDMRKHCPLEFFPLCYDFSHVSTFLNDKAVQEQIGVHKSWSSCNHLVNVLMLTDWMHNLQTLLPDMLADGISTLIYAGDVDFICNWLGNKKWTLKMEWPHKADFNAAEDKPYMLDGEKVGRLRSSSGFHFLQVYQAGHMVPMDQPAVAQQMVNEFLAGQLAEDAMQEVVV